MGKFTFAILFLFFNNLHASQWMIGKSVKDITGPPSGIGMMGYGKFDQKTNGIRTRLWARTFVIEDQQYFKKVALITVDLAFVAHAVKMGVVKKLKEQLGDEFDYKNVLIMATHTHTGPAGYNFHDLTNLTTWGFVKENYDRIVDGIVRSILEANSDLKPASIKISQGEVIGAQVNRSRVAWEQNPEAHNGEVSETNQLMTLIRFDGADGTPIGTLNWFAVHNTSMSNKVTQISSDNKGLAALQFERQMGADPGVHPTFVAAFANSNHGDVSPLIEGFDRKNDKKGNKNIVQIAGLQLDKALELYNSSHLEELNGSLSYAHSFIDFGHLKVTPEFSGQSQEIKTCRAAMGVSFAAGAEDGPGGVGVPEGVTIGKTFPGEGLLRLIGFLVESISGGVFFKDDPCQHPKKILINTGISTPHPWTPEILPLQIVQLGDLVLLAVPFEMTTVAGHRLVKKVQSFFSSNSKVIIAGLSNEFANYLTTAEEYQVQQYEGASTLYGPWTLAGVIQEFSKMAELVASGIFPIVGNEPKDLSQEQWSLRGKPRADQKPTGQFYGQQLKGPKHNYQLGQAVKVTFRGANLSNNFEKIESYLEVQIHDAVNNKWISEYFDWSPSTMVTWKYQGEVDCVSSCSRTVVKWNIPVGAVTGEYRILIRGYARDKKGKLQYFENVSDSFVVYKMDQILR